MGFVIKKYHSDYIWILRMVICTKLLYSKFGTPKKGFFYFAMPKCIFLLREVMEDVVDEWILFFFFYIMLIYSFIYTFI